MARSILVVAFLLSCGGAWAAPGDRLILDREYFQAAHDEIGKAKKSIHLISFLFLVYDKANSQTDQLLEDLIQAKKKGVKVSVILEYPKPYRGKEQPVQNRKVYERLKNAGVDVLYDDPLRTTHSKVLVIDEETVILGSHNYTYSGLGDNHEVSVLLKDKEKAKHLIEYFTRIKK